jgi:cytochrome c oxidase assembly protein subunit 11
MRGRRVTPDTVGIYFDKLQCFCFARQPLGRGESKRLDATTFVGPDVVKDADPTPFR